MINIGDQIEMFDNAALGTGAMLIKYYRKLKLPVAMLILFRIALCLRKEYN